MLCSRINKRFSPPGTYKIDKKPFSHIVQSAKSHYYFSNE